MCPGQWLTSCWRPGPGLQSTNRMRRRPNRPKALVQFRSSCGAVSTGAGGGSGPKAPTPQPTHRVPHPPKPELQAEDDPGPPRTRCTPRQGKGVLVRDSGMLPSNEPAKMCAGTKGAAQGAVRPWGWDCGRS